VDGFLSERSRRDPPTQSRCLSRSKLGITQTTNPLVANGLVRRSGEFDLDRLSVDWVRKQEFALVQPRKVRFEVLEINR
jgi:hypothetical protein